ncbi:hypothetical protein N7517_010119 [Penicillium concentricum]|uniref:Uncharacterized protein n=1 Tax=Penicillium concentricum TaxID=293559 RepID=A0A9W9RNM7_9EURO|nr:uncharacterized protein N7517_010119 [Penicillium concentricum]KAJ5360928.1 hypothetical protein N7517_010119 [Penicillium concentricum]
MSMSPKSYPGTANFILARFLEELELPDSSIYTEPPKQKGKRPAQQDASHRPVKVLTQAVPLRMAIMSCKFADPLRPSTTTVPPGSHPPLLSAPKPQKSFQPNQNGKRVHIQFQKELWFLRVSRSRPELTNKKEKLGFDVDLCITVHNCDWGFA